MIRKLKSGTGQGHQQLVVPLHGIAATGSGKTTASIGVLRVIRDRSDSIDYTFQETTEIRRIESPQGKPQSNAKDDK